MITKIISVDFDGTLCNSVVPEEGKKIWKEKTGEIYPHVGWWGRLESLDQNVFELNLFPNVVNLIKKYNSDPNSLVIILTNRMGKFEPIIKDILDKNNLHVDDIITKNTPISKAEVLLKLSDYYATVNEIILIDDDLENEHINVLKNTANKFRKNILLKFYKANNGNLILTYSNKPIGYIK